MVEGWWCLMSASTHKLINKLAIHRGSKDSYLGSLGESFVFNYTNSIFPSWATKYGITFRRKTKNKKKGWVAISSHPYQLVSWGKFPAEAALLLRTEFLKLKQKDILLTKLLTYRNLHKKEN